MLFFFFTFVVAVGALAENIVPEDPALKFVNAGDLFWLLPGIRAVRSEKPPQGDVSVVQKFFKKVLKFVYGC